MLPYNDLRASVIDESLQLIYFILGEYAPKLTISLSFFCINEAPSKLCNSKLQPLGEGRPISFKRGSTLQPIKLNLAVTLRLLRKIP